MAPEQGTALSTTVTDRSDPVRNWRAMVNPMIPPPTTTTSKELREAVTQSNGEAPCRVLRVELGDENGEFLGVKKVGD